MINLFNYKSMKNTNKYKVIILENLMILYGKN